MAKMARPKSRDQSAYSPPLPSSQEGHRQCGASASRVYRSLKHIYAQLVDDVAQRTLMTVTDSGLEGKKTAKIRRSRQAHRREGKGSRRQEGRIRSRLDTSITAA